MVALCRDLRAHRAHRRERQQRIRHRRSQDLSTASGTGQLRTQHLHDTDIHSTVYPTRTLTSATPPPAQDNTQNQEIGASLGGHRLTAHVNKPDTPFFATDAYDLIGTHSISEHAARAYPWGFFDEGVGERSRTTSTACRTRRSTSSATGIAVEIEYETANRIGPFSVSLFIKGHASHLLGDLKTRLQQTNQDPTVTGDETVNWKYSQDSWVFRASTGIRFRLVPRRRR